jgi:SAM-dependent methyltransferase
MAVNTRGADGRGGRSLESRPTEYWDAIAGEWQESSPQRLWRSGSDALHARMLRAWLPASPLGRVLKTDAFDEAFGRSGLLPPLASAARRAVSIDLSRSTLRRARARQSGFEGVASDVCRIAFADACFDFVLSNSTLDHMDSLDDVARGLAELHRVSRPGARLVLTLDNLWNPVVALRNALPMGWLQRAGIVPYRMGATCGPARLTRMLSEAGFEPERVDSLLHCPRAPAVALASVLDRTASERVRAVFVRALLAFEALGRLPTRWLTGYFIVVSAVRR